MFLLGKEKYSTWTCHVKAEREPRRLASVSVQI